MNREIHMAGSFGKQKGSWAGSPTTDPKSSGKPSAGITNDSKGTPVRGETPKGTGASGSRIR